ncbi:MAG: primosomal protein N' [Rikenellaceae bacterium]
MALYADIILPLPLQPIYTYAVGEIEGLCVGDGVSVEIGKKVSGNNFYTGIVWRLHDTQPNFSRIRKINKKLYDFPLLNAIQIELWRWIAEYYICELGDIMRIALPAMIKPQGSDEESFSRDEYQPQTEVYVALVDQIESDQLEKIKRKAPLQYKVLERIIGASESEKNQYGELPRRLIDTTTAPINSLIHKGLISVSRRPRQVENSPEVSFTLPELTPHQHQALDKVIADHQTKGCVVLRGITGSGKTEVYIHLIAKCLAEGGDALFLLPEIALTAQLIGRVERIFGSRVVSYHSKLSDKKRTENYLRLNASRGGNIVIGVRSAIFLPLRKLQLIIVDEEHDSSYKQSDLIPRYSARDCAVMLTSLVGAKTLLGSATPSLESWINSQSGKYGLAMLTQRYGEATPPQIIISDTQRAVKRGERRGHFNTLLFNKICDTIERNEQVMLFQNRRGFSPYVECDNCGWSARCPNCNVSLTLHKRSLRLICHYCDHAIPLPTTCPNCNVATPTPKGFGTEKIEEQITELIPESRVVRLDRDTASSPRAFDNIVKSFENEESNIMVGTQMITKGFDFSKVTLVGILNADNMLNNPDFRAEERAYQLMTQVAGRSGRRSDRGEVVVQTSHPTHRILKFVESGDYDAMAATLLEERELFLYPPYSRLTSITLRHRDLNRLNVAANSLAVRLREIFGRRLQGPTPPPVDRVREEWIVGFMLKIESGASTMRARELLRSAIAKWREEEAPNRSIMVDIDVDPQ